ncbi:MAG: DUF2007 domain-containing protein [Ruminococcaceae bacterium]|nr:DUF2007 domain-containing protein [Oscillospiraceae bacterium]
MSFLDKLFGLEKPAKTSPEAGELLTTAYSNEELAAIEALLRGAEIPYRLCERGAGGVVRVIAGYNMYGTDVYVKADDAETARELLTPVEDVEDAADTQNVEEEA